VKREIIWIVTGTISIPTLAPSSKLSSR